MIETVGAGEVFKLADLLPYKEGGFASMQVVRNERMILALLAFDKGVSSGSEAHAALGDVIIFALEGRGVITYEGVDHPISAGENFVFEKGGMHIVRSDGEPFKIALLRVL